MLLDEFDAIQNRGLGAALIWRSVCGYYASSNKTEGCPAVLAFRVLPLVLNEDLRSVVTSTFKSSGIRVAQQTTCVQSQFRAMVAALDTSFLGILSGR